MHPSQVEYFPSRMDRLIHLAVALSDQPRYFYVLHSSDDFLLDCHFHCFDTTAHTEFLKDIRDMELDCAEADHQFFGNLAIIQAAGWEIY
jgi:hypothetical protein